MHIAIEGPGLTSVDFFDNILYTLRTKIVVFLQ